MNDSDYALFARIIETGSLSAAARKLLISPAMVSKRLVRLEQRLGVRLIHRTTRKLTLTAAGERFHDDVTHILRAVEEAEARLSGVRDEPSGPLRVSAPTSFGRLHIAPYLHRFLEDFPRVELEFDLSDEKVDLYAGQADLAVRITSEIPANLHAHRLGENRRILCASPAYLERHGQPMDIHALQTHRLLAADGQLPWRLESGEGIRTVEGRSHVRTNSSEIVRELALCGGGIALRSLWDIHLELEAGKLVPLLPTWRAPGDLCIYALYPRSPAITAATTAFVSFLRELIDPTRWDVPVLLAA
jgi:DNA-binding transcriptional LysR family regulator